MKRLSLIFIVCIFAATTQAQTARDTYLAAQQAYENGNYTTAVTQLNETERLLGATNVRIEYLKAMCYYQTRDYEKCVSAADRYFAFNPAQGEDYQRIVQIKQQSQEQIRLAEAAQQKKLAEQEAERQRQAELARQKAAHEQEAAAEWEKLKNSSDVSALSAFLSKYKGTKPETSAQQRYNDEKAWQDAKKENYVESYEKYIAGSTLKNHRQEALDLLAESYPRLAKKYAEEGNVETMEKMAENYFKTFPKGRETDNLKKLQCDVYYKKGMALSKNRKSTTDLRKSNELLEKTKTLCPGSYDVASKIRASERKIKDLRRDDYGFFGYSGDKQTILGFSAGALKQQKIGWYLSGRVNVDLFNGESPDDYEINESGSITASNGDWLGPSGDPKTGAANFVIGINKRIVYPVWIYAGAGFSYTKLVQEYSGMQNLPGVTKPIPKATLYHSPQWRPNIDAGIMIPLGGFYLSGGVRSTFNETFLTFGGGFAF
jgi:hypothetical protein